VQVAAPVPANRVVAGYWAAGFGSFKALPIVQSLADGLANLLAQKATTSLRKFGVNALALTTFFAGHILLRVGRAHRIEVHREIERRRTIHSISN
jgi:hypothetical protein